MASDLLPVAAGSMSLFEKPVSQLGSAQFPAEGSVALLLTEAGLSSGHTLILVALILLALLWWFPSSWRSPHQEGKFGTSTSLSFSTRFFLLVLMISPCRQKLYLNVSESNDANLGELFVWLIAVVVPALDSRMFEKILRAQCVMKYLLQLLRFQDGH